MSDNASRGREGKRWVGTNHEAKVDAKKNNGGSMPYTTALVTSDFPHKDEWSEENLPEILFYIICPESKYAGLKVETLLGDDGKPIINSEGNKLRAFEILPRHISVEVPGWLVETWRRLDPRIQYQDIVDRQKEDENLNLRKLDKNALQNHCFRQCRSVLKIWLEYGRREEPHKREVETIETLSLENIKYNTILSRCGTVPSRLNRIQLVQEKDGGLYYAKPVDVTTTNVLQATFPLGHFILDKALHKMNFAMLAAWEMSLLLQERADAHGVSHWTKLPKRCLPSSWFDRIRIKTIPYDTYDGGCPEVCSWTEEKQIRDIEGGLEIQAQPVKSKKRQRAVCNEKSSGLWQAKRRQSAGQLTKRKGLPDTSKAVEMSNIQEPSLPCIFLEADEEYDEETGIITGRYTTPTPDENIDAQDEQKASGDVQEVDRDRDRDEKEVEGNLEEEGSTAAPVHNPYEHSAKVSITSTTDNDGDRSFTTSAVHGRVFARAVAGMQQQPEDLKSSISPLENQAVGGMESSSSPGNGLLELGAWQDNDLGLQGSLLAQPMSGDVLPDTDEDNLFESQTSNNSNQQDSFPTSDYGFAYQNPTSSFGSASATDLSTPFSSIDTSFSTAASSFTGLGHNNYSLYDLPPTSSYMNIGNASNATPEMLDNHAVSGSQRFQTRPVRNFSNNQLVHSSPVRGSATFSGLPQQPVRRSSGSGSHMHWSGVNDRVGTQLSYEANGLTMPRGHGLGIMTSSFSDLLDNDLIGDIQSYDFSELNADVYGRHEESMILPHEATLTTSPLTKPAGETHEAFASNESPQWSYPYSHEKAMFMDDFLTLTPV